MIDKCHIQNYLLLFKQIIFVITYLAHRRKYRFYYSVVESWRSEKNAKEKDTLHINTIPVFFRIIVFCLFRYYTFARTIFQRPEDILTSLFSVMDN